MNNTALSSEARNWAMACHLSALVGLMIGFFFVGPLVVWLMKRDSDPFIDEHGKEALNFQLTMLIAFIVAGALVLVLIGVILLPLLAIANVILVIIAGLKASNGENFRYPMCIRFLN